MKEGNGTIRTNVQGQSGGAGVDVLIGGAGDDTYRLDRGAGLDTVMENDATAGNTDVAIFLSGVATGQIWFRRVGNDRDLEASILGTSDRFVFQNWYQAVQYHVMQFKITDSNKTLTTTQTAFASLVQTMASYNPGAGATSLADVIPSQTERDNLIAAWQ